MQGHLGALKHGANRHRELLAAIAAEKQAGATTLDAAGTA
jgi:hypothetical protein